MSKKYGYARVSTQDQNLDLQIAALNRADCDFCIKAVKYRISVLLGNFLIFLGNFRQISPRFYR